MDPNETLNEIYDAISDFEKEDGMAPESRDILASVIVEKFIALDGWLSVGGFLPTKWRDR